MDWVLNNWWMVMDWLAKESVTDWLSIAAGYVTGCVILVTVGLPWLGLSRLITKRVDWVMVALLIFIAAIPAILAMIQVHTWLNIYQVWYTHPLDPPLGL